MAILIHTWCPLNSYLINSVVEIFVFPAKKCSVPYSHMYSPFKLNFIPVFNWTVDSPICGQIFSITVGFILWLVFRFIINILETLNFFLFVWRSLNLNILSNFSLFPPIFILLFYLYRHCLDSFGRNRLNLSGGGGLKGIV